MENKNNIISKKKFCEIIGRISNAHTLVDSVNSLFERHNETIGNEYRNVSTMSISFEAEMIDILEIMFNDKEEFISYFVYDLDFGKKWTADKICIRDNEIGLDISTAGKLYDFLIG